MRVSCLCVSGLCAAVFAKNRLPYSFRSQPDYSLNVTVTRVRFQMEDRAHYNERDVVV
jgi:hypothetical protein